jgi:hypothetical protein
MLRYRDPRMEMAGSQEITTFHFTLRGVPMVLEMETSMGTTLFGEPLWIAEIAEKVRAREAS